MKNMRLKIWVYSLGAGNNEELSQFGIGFSFQQQIN